MEDDAHTHRAQESFGGGTAGTLLSRLHFQRREFYSRYPETAETVVFKPGERFKDALSRQPQDVKDARTLT